jgi:acyl carrier protein
MESKRILGMDTTASTLDELKALIAQILGTEDRLDSMDASTVLLGGMPELDSVAVVELVAMIEQRFGFEVDDADFTADAFETLGTLALLIDANRS